MDDTQAGGGRNNGEWIEDMLVESLRVAVEVIGQEYVVSRMSWDSALEAGKSEEVATETAVQT